MNDHESQTIVLFGGTYYVICRCGWRSEDGTSQDAVEAEHELHTDLAGLTPGDFEGGDTTP